MYAIPTQIKFHELSLWQENRIKPYVRIGRVNDLSKCNIVNSETYLECEKIAFAAA